MSIMGRRRQSDAKKKKVKAAAVKKPVAPAVKPQAGVKPAKEK